MGGKWRHALNPNFPEILDTSSSPNKITQFLHQFIHTTAKILNSVTNFEPKCRNKIHHIFSSFQIYSGLHIRHHSYLPILAITIPGPQLSNINTKLLKTIMKIPQLWPKFWTHQANMKSGTGISFLVFKIPIPNLSYSCLFKFISRTQYITSLSPIAIIFKAFPTSPYSSGFRQSYKSPNFDPNSGPLGTIPRYSCIGLCTSPIPTWPETQHPQAIKNSVHFSTLAISLKMKKKKILWMKKKKMPFPN